jgi:hypothetical protein
MLSFFQVPKGVLQRLDYYRSRFFWQGDLEKKKYRLVVVCRPRDQGGLGIHDLEAKNIALLGKWLYKLLTEDGVWQILLRRKYVGSKALSQINWKPGDSHFWAGLMYAKKYFFRHGSFLIKDGSEIRFWEDFWLGNLPLMDQYPALYSITRNKSDTIAEVLNTSPPNVTFRRDLIGACLASWHALQERLANLQLTDEHDEFHWNLTENGKFSVDSMYKALLHSEAPIHKNKHIWKMKISLRIKVFAWYLRYGVILTKDNLVRHNWQGSPKCCFCHHDETIKHLFFQCQFAHSIW